MEEKLDLKIKIENGELVPDTETIYVNPNQITINWYDYDGTTIDENYDGSIHSWMWQVSGPDINTESVVCVEFPDMVYSNRPTKDNSKFYKVKVTQVLYDTIENNNKVREELERLGAKNDK